MRILVCGGRDFTDQERVFQELDARNHENPVTLIIEGGADGADRCARYWALSRGIACMTLHAAWAKNGKAAGPIRNGQMIRFGQPDMVLAFPGGPGTANMRVLASESSVRVSLAE